MRVRSLLATALLAVTSLPALAARLPEWARPIADAAPAIPDGPADNPTIVLFRERRIAVQPDGRFRETVRTALQILRADDDLAIGYMPFRVGDKVKTANAWHLAPGEKVDKSWSMLDVASGDSFLSDIRTRVAHVEGVRRGSLVFFEFEAWSTPETLALYELFYDDDPVKAWRLVLELPPGWSTRHEWLRRPGAEPAGSGSAVTWELRDMAPRPKGQLLGTLAERAPMLWVGLVPPAGAATPPSFTEWGAFSAWYSKIVAGTDAVTPEVQAEADRVCAAAATDLDCIVALARHVRDRVRYVAIELGIGGYRPHLAADTLKALYGDCKDKGTLLRALLAARKIPSWPVLVNATTDETVSDKVPGLWPFNHYIIAVGLGSAEVPPALAGAVLDLPGRGKVMIVDATAAHTAIGSIPPDEAGHRALLVEGGTGRLVTLPPALPASHRIARVVKGSFTGGGLALTDTQFATGDPATAERAYLDTSQEKYRSHIETTLREAWFNISGATHEIEREAADGGLRHTTTFTVPVLPKSGTEKSIPLFPGVLDWLPRTTLSKRTADIVYGYPRTLTWDTTLAGIPEGARLPAPRSLANAAGNVTTTFVREGDTVRARFEVVLAKTRFTPAEFPELKAFWSAANGAASAELLVP